MWKIVGVKASHHEVTWRVVGLLNDFGDLTVLISVEDAVPGRLLVRHLLDEDLRLVLCEEAKARDHPPRVPLLVLAERVRLIGNSL